MMVANTGSLYARTLNATTSCELGMALLGRADPILLCHVIYSSVVLEEWIPCFKITLLEAKVHLYQRGL